MLGTTRLGVLALALASIVACTEDPGPTSTAWDPDGSGPSTSSAAQDGSSSEGDAESSGGSSGGGESTTGVSVGDSTSSDGSSGTGEGDCPRVRTSTPGDVLNVRPTPDTTMAPVGALPDGSVVDKVAEVMGEPVNGNAIWVEIDSASMGLHGFVSTEFVTCTTDPAT